MFAFEYKNYENSEENNAMNITTPLTKDVIHTLRCGDNVTISGYISTARDAAHKRMYESAMNNEELPFDLKDQIIYYVGPCPAKPGNVIGSCGPTTSYRMDAYAPLLISMGLGAMIGKGLRSDEVKQKCIECGAVYLGALGGGGALLSNHITEAEVIAYDDLGTEAIRRLTVKDFPATVIIDSAGNDLYEIGKKEYRDMP
ncbi:MAG: Fe-S-containing hydro-lyase [Clostridia bacterium]|nr:Fe-S-containing hydro-lyase [Clostridia bacterium]